MAGTITLIYLLAYLLTYSSKSLYALFELAHLAVSSNTSSSPVCDTVGYSIIYLKKKPVTPCHKPINCITDETHGLQNHTRPGRKRNRMKGHRNWII